MEWEILRFVEYLGKSVDSMYGVDSLVVKDGDNGSVFVTFVVSDSFVRVSDIVEVMTDFNVKLASESNVEDYVSDCVGFYGIENVEGKLAIVFRIDNSIFEQGINFIKDMVLIKTEESM